MKLLPKLGLLGLISAVGATIYAAPNMRVAQVDGAVAMRANELHGEVARDLIHIQHLQSVAHRDHDVIKVNCVNDRFVQAKAEMNIADHAQITLQGGVDVQGAISQLQNAATETHRMRESADQCIGETPLSESSNTFTHPEIVDPTTTNPWGGGVIEWPNYASPYQ